MATTASSEDQTAPTKPDDSTQETIQSSTPVEMSDLKASAEAEESQQDATAGAEATEETEKSSPTPKEELETPSKPTPTRKQSEALGPATDLPISAPPQSTSGPTLAITLLLITGARHPYRIDEKYLKTRKVDAKATDGNFDPREMSGYKLKELIWTDWRNEWEVRPASPTSIRLIILGRLIEDKSPLKELPFKLDDTNVVHMTVKPADFLDDDDTGGKKGHSMRGADGEGTEAGCCRCVIL